MPPSSAAAYQSLQNYQGQEKAPTDILNNAQSQYGTAPLASQLAALRTTTGNLQTSIAGVDPSVTGRTQGSLVTEAQRGRLVNMEKAPLVGQLNTATANQAELGKQFDTANQMAAQFATTSIQGQNQKYTQLLDTYNAAKAAEAQAAAQAQAERAYQLQIQQFQQTQLQDQRNYQLAQSANATKASAASAAASAPALDPNSNYNGWLNAVNTYKGQGLSWGAAAAKLEAALGSKIPTGSLADQAFHQAFTGIK